MERKISGQILLDSKDIPLSPTSKSLENPEMSLTGITIKETSADPPSDEDGVLQEVDKNLDGKKDRRKLTSVLKSTGRTPVIGESHAANNTNDEYELGKTNSKRPTSPSGRECCAIL